MSAPETEIAGFLYSCILYSPILCGGSSVAEQRKHPFSILAFEDAELGLSLSQPLDAGANPALRVQLYHLGFKIFIWSPVFFSPNHICGE
ncbi:hypothetical protein NIES3974_27700 [Calothrix sp. NIES-3974]|nr:hypothetical protein NIES3974_27700 [Calothrix sp. NIES-3974]